MHGWSGALFVATGLSALFAFGLVQTTFAPQAQALFFVFSVVLVLVTVGNWVGHEHGPAAASIGKKIGGVAILGGLIAVIYAWVDNDWTAEKAGREIDRATLGLYRQVAATVTDLRAPQRPAEEEEAQVR